MILQRSTREKDKEENKHQKRKTQKIRKFFKVLCFGSIILCFFYFLDFYNNFHTTKTLGAIVYLHRTHSFKPKGFDFWTSYGNLMSKNCQNWSKNYPIYILHTRNFDEPHFKRNSTRILFKNWKKKTEKLIDNRKKFGFAPMYLVDISSFWPTIGVEMKIPKNLEEQGWKHDWDIGYRRMCNFMASQIFKLPFLKNYEYIMRVDTDAMIQCESEFTNDPFKTLKKENKIYGTVQVGFDETQVTFKYQEILNRIGIQIPLVKTREFEILDEHNAVLFEEKIPTFSTCFEIMKNSYFQSKTIQNLLEKIDKTLGAFLYRWGDAIIRFTIVNIHNTSGAKLKKKTYEDQIENYSPFSENWYCFGSHKFDIKIFHPGGEKFLQPICNYQTYFKNLKNH